MVLALQSDSGRILNLRALPTAGAVRHAVQYLFCNGCASSLGQDAGCACSPDERIRLDVMMQLCQSRKIIKIMQRKYVASLAVALLLGPSLSGAEIPPRQQSDLDRAPRILNGVVTSIVDKPGAVDGCETRHDVSISVQEKVGDAPKVARGFYDVWACPKQTKAGQAAPDLPMPPGHHETWGIKSLKAGDRVKIYSDEAGDIYEPNGIQLLKSPRP